MESKPRLIPILLLTIGILPFLGACAAIQTPPAPAPVSPVSPTADASPTATVIWFPPTETPTPRPVIAATSTPNHLPGMGSVIATDTFDSAALWNTGTSDEGSATVSRNRITLAIQPGVTMISLRSEPVLTDFYAEITARTSLCKGKDSYGLLFRANPAAYYRYALSCDGTVRLDRISVRQRIVLQPPTPSGDAPPGSPGDVRLGVWAVGTELRFFLNGRYQFTVIDPNLAAGTLGVFAHANGETAMTVTFSDLVIKSVSYASPTPTLTPTKTPMPTRTPLP
ncbi:MAG: hypothetical protein GXP40_03395 [Chloroflexi bacterium]|nr:hypothetical protein [Chloroflexota bacterium]